MTILVVEDEPKTGVFLQQGLSEAGFAVERVTDGTAALQRALTTPYELLILDIMLPGLDGWQVLSQLRAAGQQLALRLEGLRQHRTHPLQMPLRFLQGAPRQADGQSIHRRFRGRVIDVFPGRSQPPPCTRSPRGHHAEICFCGPSRVERVTRVFGPVGEWQL